MKKPVDRYFAPKGYYAVEYKVDDFGCEGCAFEQEKQKACSCIRPCLPCERPDGRCVIFLLEKKDYGCNPLSDGRFEMVPSGDIVDIEEKEARLQYIKHKQGKTDCFGLSWEQIARVQGGLHTLDITKPKKPKEKVGMDTNPEKAGIIL